MISDTVISSAIFRVSSKLQNKCPVGIRAPRPRNHRASKSSGLNPSPPLRSPSIASLSITSPPQALHPPQALDPPQLEALDPPQAPPWCATAYPRRCGVSVLAAEVCCVADCPCRRGVLVLAVVVCSSPSPSRCRRRPQAGWPKQ